MPRLKDIESQLEKEVEKGNLAPETFEEVKTQIKTSNSNDPKEKIKESVKNQQIDFYKDRPEENGVLFKDSYFFNPDTGKPEQTGDISRTQFNDLVNSGKRLVSFGDKKPQEMSSASLNQNVNQDTLPAGQMSEADFLKNKQESKAGGIFNKIIDKMSDVPSRTGFIPDEYVNIKLRDPNTKKPIYFKNLDQDTLNKYKRDGFLVEYAEPSRQSFDRGTVLRKPGEEPNQELASVEQPGVTEQPLEPNLEKPVSPNMEESTKLKISGPMGSLGSGSGVGAIPDIYKDAREANKLLSEDEQRINQEKRVLLEKQGLQEEELAQKKADLQNEKIKEIEKKYTEYQNDVEAIKNTKISADNFWANKSTGSKVLAGIGLFLGAMPNSTGQNTAVGVIDKAIERDMEAQKANLDKMIKGLDFKRNEITDLYAKYQDKDLALIAGYAGALGKIANQMKILTETSSNEKIKANALLGETKIKESEQALRQQMKEMSLKEQELGLKKIGLLFEMQQKQGQQKDNPFMIEQQKKQADQLVKDMGNLGSVQTRLDTAKEAWTLLDKVSTGPVVGSWPVKFGRKLLNKDFQQVENLFSKLGLDAIKQLSQEGGGAKSVDSDAEKKFLLETVPGLNKDNEVNKKILLVSNSMNKRQQLDTQLRREWAMKYGNLDQYVSPLENLKSYFDPSTGEVEFFPPNKQPSGYESVSKFVSGKDSINGQANNKVAKPSWAK